MWKTQDRRLARVAENRQDKGRIPTEQLCSYYQYHKHTEKMVRPKRLQRLCYCLITEGYFHWWELGRVWGRARIGGGPVWRKKGKIKGASPPNNSAVIINIINTAKKWSGQGGRK